MTCETPVALVTGSARGIGRAIATTLANAGMHVALVDILADDLHATADALATSGASVLPVVADITDPQAVDALAEQVERDLGPVDALVNNAGTFSTIGNVWELDPDRWFRDTRVNLFGSFLCCRAFVGRMVQRRQGRVINMVSAGGVGDPHPQCTSYACSKTALMRLTEGLAAEAAPHGVSVFALAPPAVDTAMTRYILESPEGRQHRPNFKELFENHEDRPPQLIAEWCLKLLGGRADRLTGRYFLATEDFEAILAATDTILAEDLMTLRLRPTPK